MAEIVYTLRDATEDDYEFMYRVMAAVRTPDTAYDEAAEREKFAKSFELEGLHVIEYRGQDVGRVRFTLHDTIVYLNGIQILPLFQSRGIGTAVLFDLTRQAAYFHVDVVLEVHESNIGAQRFYKKMGFRPYGRHSGDPSLITMRCITKR